MSGEASPTSEGGGSVKAECADVRCGRVNCRLISAFPSLSDCCVSLSRLWGSPPAWLRTESRPNKREQTHRESFSSSDLSSEATCYARNEDE